MRWPCVCVQDGWTPLRAAAGNGDTCCVELLLGKGAKVDRADNVGEGLQGVAAPPLVHLGFMSGKRRRGVTPTAPACVHSCCPAASSERRHRGKMC